MASRRASRGTRAALGAALLVLGLAVPTHSQRDAGAWWRAEAAADPVLGGVAARLPDIDGALVPALLALRAHPELRPAAEIASVERALDRAPWADLAAWLAAAVRAAPDAETRGSALALAGRRAAATDLELLLQLAAPAPGAELEPEVVAAFADALRGALARAPESVACLERLYERAPPALLLPIVDATAATRLPAAARALAGMLEKVPAADVAVLFALERLASDLDSVPDDVHRAVRRSLAREDALVAGQAARTAGALRDEGAVLRLLELIDDPRAPVACRARGALETITAFRFATSREWQAWFAQECAWWQDGFADCRARLLDGTGSVAVHAVQELAGRRLHRAEIEQTLVLALARREPAVRTLAAAALGQMRASRAAAAELVPLLDEHDLAVRRCAWNALRQITRWKLPPRAVVWREVLAEAADS